jgi:hypothetical protein
MARRKPLHAADLRGAVRLAAEATAGLTDLVEAVHSRIAHVPLPGRAAPDGRTRGFTGLVYKSIRGVTRGVGGSLDALLGLLGKAPPAGLPDPEREAVVAALNGVLGDHLAATDNPLAIPMRWRHAGQPLPEGLGGPRLLVLLHGLCMNDLQWQRDGHDHGAALARDLGFTPVYLHYNSGRHISVNGRELAGQLEALLAAWPSQLERLVLLGHSMGGLVARSALHQAAQSGLRWPARLDDLVFLGTPHHGAPLERAGHGVDRLLGALPYAAPLARLGKVRSAGITDLRHGSLLETDWAGRDRFAHGADPRQPVPLPAHVRCYAAAALLGEHAGTLKARLLGDGLVPLDSALGRHADAGRTLAFAEHRQWVGQGFGHLDLLSSPAVYTQLRDWLGVAG